MLKKIKETAGLLAIIALKHIEKKIEKEINLEGDESTFVSDFKIQLYVKEELCPKHLINGICEILEISDKEKIKMLLDGAFFKGFAKRGYTSENVTEIEKKLKELGPLVNVNVITVLAPKR